MGIVPVNMHVSENITIKICFNISFHDVLQYPYELTSLGTTDISYPAELSTQWKGG